MSKKLSTLNSVAKIAHKLDINLWIYGSFAVEILTGKSINPSGDVDITCSRVKDYKLLIQELTQKHGYKAIKISSWTAMKFGKAHNAKLTGPNDVEIDISFIKGEISTAYRKTILSFLPNKNIHIFSAVDLLKIYKKFGKRNPRQNEQKILLLKNLTTRSRP